MALSYDPHSAYFPAKHESYIQIDRLSSFLLYFVPNKECKIHKKRFFLELYNYEVAQKNPKLALFPCCEHIIII